MSNVPSLQEEASFAPLGSHFRDLDYSSIPPLLPTARVSFSYLRLPRMTW